MRPLPRRRPRHRVTLMLGCALLTLALALAGCGDDSDEPQARPQPSAPSVITAPGLPPSDVESLRPIVEPLVSSLGLRLARGSLADLSTRYPTADGRHLALYVEPTTQWTSTQFVSAIVPTTKALAPPLFAQYPGLESFDVCIEPSPGVDDRPEPTSLTIVDMSRRVSESINWDTADLSTLLARAITDPAEMRVGIHEELSRDAVYQLAQSQARETAGDGGEGGQTAE